MARTKRQGKEKAKKPDRKSPKGSNKK